MNDSRPPVDICRLLRQTSGRAAAVGIRGQWLIVSTQQAPRMGALAMEMLPVASVQPVLCYFSFNIFTLSVLILIGSQRIFPVVFINNQCLFN